MIIVGFIVLAVIVIGTGLFLWSALPVVFHDIPKAMYQGFKGTRGKDQPQAEVVPDWAQDNPGDPTKGWAGF